MKQRLARDLKTAIPACVVTFLLFLLCGRVYGIFPCGAKSIVWCDMEQQAVPLLMQLRELVKGGGSPVYSLLDAGGMEFYGIFFFFLSNPLSLLVLVTDLPADLLVNLLVFLKLALAAGTAAVWLRHRVEKLPGATAVLLAVMYGCSGYGLFYYQNLMWLDIMVMLPLLMMALRHLLYTEGKYRALPYFFCLCAMMVLCFYVCYMVVIFTILYVALSLRYTVPKQKKGEAARKFWGASIVAACVTAVIWIPCFVQVMHSARSDSTVSKLMHAWLVNNLQDKLLVLGCTGIVFAVLPMMLAGLQPMSEAKRDSRLLLLLVLPVLIDPINMMWHTGSYQAFPFRWAMIPILLLLTRAAEMLTGRGADEKPVEKHRMPPTLRLGLMLVAVILAACLTVRFGGEHLLSYVQTLWVSLPQFGIMLPFLLLCVCTYIMLLWYRRTRQISLRAATLFAAMLFCVEFAFHFHCYVGSAADEDKLFTQTVSAAHVLPEDNDDPLARVRMTKKYAHANMVGALGYPTLAHYTSMTREDFMHGVKRMGYSSYWMEVNSTGGTVLSDAVWHIKYLLGSGSDLPPWSRQIWADNRLKIGESSMVLPAALAVDTEPSAIAELPMGERAGVQRFLAENLLGTDDLLTDYPVTELQSVTLTQNPQGETVCTLDEDAEEGVISWSIFVKDAEALYFDLYSQTKTEIKTVRDDAVAVTVNGKTAEGHYPESSHNGFVYLGAFEGSYVTVRVKVHKSFTCESFGLFGIGTDRLAAAIAAADGCSVQYAGRTFTADYHADAPKTLIFSVAYDEGFTATVNGEKTDVSRVCDCMTAVRVPAGDNHVTLTYHVCGLREGLLLMLCGVLLAVLFLMLCRRPHAEKTLGEMSLRLTSVAYTGVLLAVYVLPVILWAAGVVQKIVG